MINEATLLGLTFAALVVQLMGGLVVLLIYRVTKQYGLRLKYLTPFILASSWSERKDSITFFHLLITGGVLFTLLIITNALDLLVYMGIYSRILALAITMFYALYMAYREVSRLSKTAKLSASLRIWREI